MLLKDVSSTIWTVDPSHFWKHSVWSSTTSSGKPPAAYDVGRGWCARWRPTSAKRWKRNCIRSKWRASFSATCCSISFRTKLTSLLIMESRGKVSQCQCVHLYSRPPNALGALVPCEHKCLAPGGWKELRWSSDFGQGSEDCSTRTDQQWQKPGGRRPMYWVGDVARKSLELSH